MTWLDAGTVPEKKGSHMTSDCTALREILLREHGVVPKVYLKSLTRPRKLAWQGIVVHEAADREWQTIKQLLELAGLKWRNDGWGGALFRIAEQTLRPKRRAIPKQVANEVRSRNLCEACGHVPGQEIHHVRAVVRHGSDEPANLLWLCKECHARTTREECPRSMALCASASTLSGE